MNWIETGRFLMLTGVILIVLGMLFLFGDRIPLGRLPGDVHIGNSKIDIYIPVATCVLLSVVITLVINFFFKR
jgi:hypothetical protein